MELRLDREKIIRARELSQGIVDEVMTYIHNHTTVSVERAYLRLLGIDGIDANGVPLPNVVVKQLQDGDALSRGVCYWMANAMHNHGLTLQEVAEQAARGKLNLLTGKENNPQIVLPLLERYAENAIQKIDHQRKERQRLQQELGKGREPLLYIIVATGDIYADIEQAKAGVMQGADIVAVIRHTAQSLFDYVPYSATDGGVGGTYATQENFHIMRQAMDDAGRQAGKYIMVTNYCSGLCMPEIAVMGAMERLDVMLNDSMYGIIFRDINMRRTLIDQYISRMLNGYAGIIINTGEDNYLTTADAYEKAHTVIASQFINERFALESGLKEEQIGLGHAYEISPNKKDSLLMELAQAQLVRQLFPNSPIKYMPPTKHMTGNIFKGHVQNTLFNLTSILTGQSIHLLGMLTEALHTPHLQDRYLSVEGARYVFDAAGSLADELVIKPGGQMEQRAAQVLNDAVDMLEEINSLGLMNAISRGMFADIARQPDGGKGQEGVVTKSPDYYTPFIELLRERRATHGFKAS
ncbi:lysine 5,6-aminomutase subunit alpha [Dethiobacter alkaliphilus]|uniref:lysine 5,6-aminomutase subunit alpha n=1 Tax=Dethiobacter alkaliphilus TaxID=427926 RepID=UPI002226E4DD|nr:lysine 5,6-aminomutase subunit alpha [Dethiobacter alkaliphilus]MCW3490321.1 lysine 5,6-aminomutase subunit alpha [Dethiobacter alkaliphilus]